MLPLMLLLSAASHSFVTRLSARTNLPRSAVVQHSAHFRVAEFAQLRGGGQIVAQAAAAASEDHRPGPEQALKPTAFIFVLSVALVALAAPQYLVATLGATPATALLASVASFSALAEILLAPIVGALSDSVGRKPTLLLTLGVTLVANAAVTLVPTVPMIVFQAFVSKLVVGLFFLSSGAALGDAYRTDPGRLAQASGILFALVNGGFAVGIALSRFLPTSSLRWGYGAATAMASCAFGIAAIAVRETMAPADRVPFRIQSFNPISCVRLFSNGGRMRLLALLLAITLQPIFMGDVIQVYAIEEWGLGKPQIATFFTLIPVLGALGNVVGGRCVKAIGVKAFTALATLSNMLFWAGCLAGHKAALVCAVVGFLGPARTLGASTALTTLGASKGIPQGQLSGDRSNMIALLKVLGPAVYGSLFLRGKAAGLPGLPFVLNLLLTFWALLLAPLALTGIDEEKSGNDESGK